MKVYPRGRPYRIIEEKIAENILGAGVMGATLALSPIAGAVVYLLGIGAAGYLFRKRDFNREVKRLEKKGYIALTKTEKGRMIKILKKGKRRYNQIQIENLRLTNSPRWDQKWRLFIFDIPEKRRSYRDSLRRKIKKLGMYNIQRSVFAYPYDCRKELRLITEYYGLDKYTTYAEVIYSDIDRELHKHFKSLKILS